IAKYRAWKLAFWRTLSRLSWVANGAKKKAMVCPFWPCCTDHGWGRNDPYPVLGSCDADVGRASQLQHAVQDLDRHVHLRLPTLVCVRAHPIPDHALVASDGGLGAGPVRVPGRHLPPPAAPLSDELKVAVPLGRRGLGRLAGHCRGARGYDDGRRGMALGDAGVDAVLIVRPVAGERGDRAVHLVEQGTDLRAVIHVVG